MLKNIWYQILLLVAVHTGDFHLELIFNTISLLVLKYDWLKHFVSLPVLRSTTWWFSPMHSWSTCRTLPALTSPNFAPAPVTATVWTPWRTSSTRTCPGSTARPLSSTSPPRGTSKNMNRWEPASPSASELLTDAARELGHVLTQHGAAGRIAAERKTMTAKLYSPFEHCWAPVH